MRWISTVIAGLMAVVAIGVAPHALAGDAPIGRLGDTLRVEFNGIIADVTVHDVLPSDIPPGWTWNGSPRWRYEGGPWRAAVTVHAVQVPNPYKMALSFAFDGVTPFADAYAPKHTDAPDALEAALMNAPQGSTVNGAVYWHVYRDLVSNVVLLNPQTGVHLAQWNL
ncbi:MAG: hypothetical protein JWR37_5903 [Mycobacterium sp.]|jgi:hypothetical protein|nr:hypothetical protein [Mycobacterium sp.]